MAKKKIGMVSLGCPKNLVDSEVMMGLLAQSGYELTSDPTAAQIIVINTCGFIDAARQESIETILEMARLKQEGSLERLIVAGCLVERYRDQLQREIPEIDACIGVNQLEDVLLTAGPATSKLTPIYSAAAPELYLYDETKPRLRATPPYTAYVKIAEGCDHTCSFCIIPKLRGPFRSRPPESILREIERLVAEGVKEVILVSQDTTNYGADLGLKDGLAKLIEAAARVPGLQWLRFLYCYPTAVSDHLLRVVAECENVCSYFDIPLQHSSRRLLSLMRRGGNRELYERLIDRIRERVPGATIRTTFIVGFPGEREEDFEDLLDFVRKVEFDRAGVFTYSDEEGSAAFELSQKVDPSLARRRARRLIGEQARICRRKNRALIGGRVRVLFEGLSKESDLLFEGRMESQAPEIDGSVLINQVPPGFNAKPGDFVTVEITRAHEYDLVGRVV
jgi:ribosomal protein S12 methylthiotransferase